MSKKVSKATIKAFNRVIGELEVWQHRKDAPEHIVREVGFLKSRLIDLLNRMETENE